MYNRDHHLCIMCDDEPAVYNGLCATCLSDAEDDDLPDGRKVKPTYRRKDDREEDYYGR